MVTPQSCLNHPYGQTEQRCAQCGQPFCENCLVELKGQPLCAICKARTVREMQRRGGGPSRLAHEAFMLSVIGLVLFGPVLQPLALLKGLQALRMYRARPDQPDRWKARAAVIIAGLLLAVYGVAVGLMVVNALRGRG